MVGAKGGQTAPKITLAFVLDVGRKHTLRSLTGQGSTWLQDYGSTGKTSVVSGGSSTQ